MATMDLKSKKEKAKILYTEVTGCQSAFMYVYLIRSRKLLANRCIIFMDFTLFQERFYAIYEVKAPP